MAEKTGNPLKFDDELVDMLDNLSNIKTYKRFKGWRNNFLERFESFLNQNGTDKAEKQYCNFQKEMTTISKFLDKCNVLIDKGDLTNERTTVKGRTCLNELCKELTICCKNTDALIPSTNQDEKKAGYNKFQLGAVLVRDGFSEFDRMMHLNECLRMMGKEKLSEVADRQQHDLFDDYAEEVKKFCDVMADLGLYEVMLACRRFAEEPEEEEPDPISITIKCSDGKTMKLELDSSELIGNVKDAIVDACGIPADKQIMKFRGKVLTQNENTLDDCGITDGSVLTVEPVKVPVTVNAPDGKKIKVMVDTTRPLRDIKEKLEKDTGLTPDNQRLFMEGNELLDDDAASGDYGIGEGSVLDLEPRSIKVTIETPDGKQIEVELNPNDTQDDIKNKIEAKTGIAQPRQILKHQGKELPKGGIKVKDMGLENGSKIKVEILKVPVTVRTMDGKKIKVMVDPTQPISAIKKKIEPESGIPANNQRLFMNKQELKDDETPAEEYGIQEGSVLDMEPKKINVTITDPDGNKHSIEIKPSDTSNDIKKTIESKTGIKPKRQVLKLNGKELPGGNATVKDMGIQDGDDIKVSIFKVPVTVNTMDGKKIKIMVDPTDTLGGIKKQLENDSGIAANNQRLFMNAQELPDDNKTAEEYGIEEGSELDLEPKKMKVTVEDPDGNKHEIDVKPSDNTDQIKAKVAEKTGIAKPRQVLKLDGKVLPKGKTAKDMGIRDGSNIKCDIFKVPITVNTMDGKKIKVMVDPTDKIGDIKKQLEDDSGIPAKNQNLFFNGKPLADDTTAKDNGIEEGSELDLEPKTMKVTVEDPDGNKHQIDVKPSDTSDKIKEKVAEKTGIAKPRQVLKLDGKVLPKGSKTAKDMGIRDGSNIKCDIFKVPVTVNTMDGKKIKVMVDPTDKIGDIKKQLEDESGIPAKNQNLFFNGKPLADDTTAKDNGIQEGSELDLEPKNMKVTVEDPDGNKHDINVKPSDTTEQIKDKVEEKTGIKPKRQVLKVNGKPLSRGKKAKDMGIRDGSNIKCDIFKVPITVTTMDGKKISLDIDPTDSMGDIKKQLEDDSGLPAKNIKLFLNGTELKDDKKSAEDYGIKKGSELDLEPKTIKVNVEDPDGNVHSITIKPSDDVNAIKNAIEDATDIAVPRQVVKHGGPGGKELPNNITVKDMGIRDGHDLKVSIFKIPIFVKTEDGKTLNVDVEPKDTISSLKKILHKMTGLEPKKQVLTFGEYELKNGKDTITYCGIKKGSELDLEKLKDPIIFVDVKCGTLFGVEREDVVSRQMLHPLDGNVLDFREASTGPTAKENMKKVMLDSKKLGFNPQVVVEKDEVEEYDMQEAEAVKNKWGVSLKKNARNKKGEEFIFVDPKTGQAGELARKKYIQDGFITVKGETLEEAEHDTQKYDKYITQIRDVFGVRSAK